MAALALDPLAFTHALEEAGFTRDQAELVAQVGTAMFVQNFDALVTRDYLDTRFSEFETRILSTMELRFKDIDAKMDLRFKDADAKMKLGFKDVDAKMELRFKDVDAKFGKLYIMGGIIIASTVIPALQKLFVWLG